MIRPVLSVTEDGVAVTGMVEVGEGFEAWNKAIRAQWGELVVCPDGHELWCDEEGLLRNRPYNAAASVVAGRPIVGDAILFDPGDVR